MVSFENDYNTGAHPEVLRRLLETNLEPQTGYGADKWCASAAEKIRLACQSPDAEVEFIAGGTQTNAVVIASLLRDWEGVIAADTGHVAAHEAGAIEYTGHKVLTLPQHEGKLAPSELEAFLHAFYGDSNREHMVWPGMVYLSHPTEFGTLYTKAELAAIRAICRRYGMKLYLDGARLACGLMCASAELTLPDLAENCDAFYIGGTKCGALCGEAAVIPRHGRPAHFTNAVKKRGALLAKGRLLGVQFDALFTDGLYFRIGRHEADMAEKLKGLFRERDISLWLDSPTNQQFVELEDGQIEKLKEKVAFSFWEKTDETHTVIRFVTGWSTTEEDLKALAAALDELK
ncbi:MAG: low specificity L-threonine aldolase [Oscillospiraceae bacterium]|nr:low specificity L-threonine aldolase [Oscillospiraceae bacterium]